MTGPIYEKSSMVYHSVRQAIPFCSVCTDERMNYLSAVLLHSERPDLLTLCTRIRLFLCIPLFSKEFQPVLHGFYQQVSDRVCLNPADGNGKKYDGGGAGKRFSVQPFLQRRFSETIGTSTAYVQRYRPQCDMITVPPALIREGLL